MSVVIDIQGKCGTLNDLLMDRSCFSTSTRALWCIIGIYDIRLSSDSRWGTVDKPVSFIDWVKLSEISDCVFTTPLRPAIYIKTGFRSVWDWCRVGLDLVTDFCKKSTLLFNESTSSVNFAVRLNATLESNLPASPCFN